MKNHKIFWVNRPKQTEISIFCRHPEQQKTHKLVKVPKIICGKIFNLTSPHIRKGKVTKIEDRPLFTNANNLSIFSSFHSVSFRILWAIFERKIFFLTNTSLSLPSMHMSRNVFRKTIIQLIFHMACGIFKVFFSTLSYGNICRSGNPRFTWFQREIF